MSEFGYTDKRPTKITNGTIPEKLVMEIHVVLSYDNGLVGVTTKFTKALEMQSKQKEQEEYAGGRPKVRIETTTLIE